MEILQIIMQVLLGITSVLLTLLILLHKGRGGGLSDMFGGGISTSIPTSSPTSLPIPSTPRSSIGCHNTSPSRILRSPKTAGSKPKPFPPKPRPISNCVATATTGEPIPKPPEASCSLPSCAPGKAATSIWSSKSPPPAPTSSAGRSPSRAPAKYLSTRLSMTPPRPIPATS